MTIAQRAHPHRARPSGGFPSPRCPSLAGAAADLSTTGSSAPSPGSGFHSASAGMRGCRSRWTGRLDGRDEPTRGHPSRGVRRFRGSDRRVNCWCVHNLGRVGSGQLGVRGQGTGPFLDPASEVGHWATDVVALGHVDTDGLEGGEGHLVLRIRVVTPRGTARKRTRLRRL